MTRNKTIILLAGLTGGCFAAGVAFALDVPADSTPADGQAFQIITERNIFNPSRGLAPVVETNPPALRVESVALRGMLTYADKSYAFFESADGPVRSQALRPLDAVAGCSIVEIAGDTVRLLTSGNQIIELRVGMRMQRVGDGPWEPAADAEPSLDSNLSGSSFPASAGGADEAVKLKMKQRRDRELKN